tara:strand:- start:26485 stop:26670 length:186 start_codon:yes stop_codon:yes gene_type:complete
MKENKYNSDDLRQCFTSSDNKKNFETYKIITETYNPTKEDFEYCLKSQKSFKIIKWILHTY